MPDEKEELLKRLEAIKKEREEKCTQALHDLLTEMDCNLVVYVEINLGGKQVTVPVTEMINGTPQLLIKAN